MKTLYLNGTVLTLDSETDRQGALLVDGDTVLGLGAVDEMKALAGEETETVDLDGAFVLPGLIDSHPHAMHFTAYRVGAVDITEARNFDEIVAAIQARAEVTPKGEWIACTPIGEPHYFVRRDYTALEERRMPDRHLLDKAAPEHPVWIMAWAPRTPNVCAFNSLGLKRLGLSEHHPDKVCNVELEKDASGLLTGVIRGSVNNYYNDDPFWHAISSRLPILPDNVWELAGAAGLQTCNADGITGLYEAHAMMPPHLSAYEALGQHDLASARVVMSLELSGYAFSTLNYSDDDVWALLAYGEAAQQKEDPLVRTNGVTLSRGGPLTPGYLRMNDPYTGPFGEKTRGKTFLSRDIEKRVLSHCLENGLRLNMVLGGYRDNDDFLQSLAEVGEVKDIAASDWVLQHCYFASPDHIKAFKNYNFHVTSSASFVYGKADVVKEKFPPSHMEDFIAMRKFVEADLNFACGSDWGPDSPWRQMALNETRESAHSGHHHLEHANQLTRLQSLHAFTRNGAAVMQWPELGRLRPGGLADLAIIDRDPFRASPESLAETKVLRTVMNGSAVFDTGALQGGPVSIPIPAHELIAKAMQPNA